MNRKEILEAIKQKHMEIQRLYNQLDSLEISEEELKIESPKAYLRRFCENEFVLDRLMNKLTAAGAVNLYITEHKRQVNSNRFGKGGKMTDEADGMYFSGVDWEQTENGYFYWSNIFP